MTGRVDRLSVFALPPDIVVQRDLRIPVGDGITLSANLFLPRHRGARLPVVAALTRYDKDDPPARYMAEGSALRRSIGLGLGDYSVSDATPFEAPDPAAWVPHGYAVVHIDARGTGLSDGSPVDTYGPQVVADFRRAIAWLAEQPWSSGRIGLCGVSYLAIMQYLVAIDPPPGLAAVIPWEGMADRYRDVAFHGGIPETGFTPWIAGGGVDVPGSDAPPRFDAPNSPLLVDLDLPSAELDRITLPMLVCASWSDQGLHTRGSIAAFVQARSAEKRLFTHGRGKWTVFHGPEATAWQRAFFDRHLKVQMDALDGYPRVRIETRIALDRYVVRDEATWPPRGTRWQAFHLDAATGRLLDAAPAEAATQSWEPASDGIDFALTFDSDTEITGGAALTLPVSSAAGDDIDLFAALRKFDAAGEEVFFEARENDERGLVALGWLRASHRAPDPLSRPERPLLAHDRLQPVQPGQVLDLHVEILPSSTWFEAGSTLVLTIAGRDIHHNRMCQHRALRNGGTMTVHTGAGRTARLLLPIVPAEDAASAVNEDS